MAECTGGAVTPIKCRKCLTTEFTGRAEAPEIASTPAVAQVVPVKNSYYRKNTSNEKLHGQMGLASLFRQIHLQEGNLEIKQTPTHFAMAGPKPGCERSRVGSRASDPTSLKTSLATETEATTIEKTQRLTREDSSTRGPMTQVGESPREASRPTNLLTMKAIAKVAT